jgi:hypothetical protein
MPSPTRAPVAFLFLGETLLIPHLWPIVPALARMAPDLHVDLWVISSVHEGLLGQWLKEEGLDPERVRIRRAPGYRNWPGLKHGENPPLPSKIPILARLLPSLLGTEVIVCAEQTSLWLPTVLPFWRARFIMTQHGAGSLTNRASKRRLAAFAHLMPSEFEADEYARFGVPRDRMRVTGYVKSAFHGGSGRPELFAEKRPTVLYTPHWQRFRSSWWAWGRPIVEQLAAQTELNVILAPHQRLVDTDPDVGAVLARVADLPHVHTDLDSFAMVDGTYTSAADIYLGDTSSQVCEFLIRPRPCVFLNPEKVDWRTTGEHGFWECGQVVDQLDDVLPALRRAPALEPQFEATQRAFVAKAVGDCGEDVADRAAAAILEALPDSAGQAQT